MGIDPAKLTEPLLRCMTPGDRRKLGKRGVTRAEAEQIYSSRQETKIHDQFASFLHRHELPFVHSNPRRKSSIAQGHPDFLIVVNCKALYIEFKVHPNTLSQFQKDYIKKLQRWNNRVLIITETEPGTAYTDATRAVWEHFKLSEISNNL